MAPPLYAVLAAGGLLRVHRFLTWVLRVQYNCDVTRSLYGLLRPYKHIIKELVVVKKSGSTPFDEKGSRDYAVTLAARYMEISSQLCKKPSDYTKEHIRRHNRAMKERMGLAETIAGNLTLAQQVYRILLSQNDLYIRQSAATDCLNLGIHTVQSVEILTEISGSQNRMAAMGAQRALAVWRGEISASEPF